MARPSLAGTIEQATAVVDGPLEVASKAEYWEIVRSALSPKLFRVVSMYFRESSTQEDIAERIGVSQQRAGRLIAEALERLRRPKFKELLERAIPAARKPPIAGHTALHAYEIAVYAQGESPEDKEFDAEQAKEIWADNRRRASWREDWDAPSMGGFASRYEEGCMARED